jgi:hypothetical protein
MSEETTPILPVLVIDWTPSPFFQNEALDTMYLLAEMRIWAVWFPGHIIILGGREV